MIKKILFVLSALTLLNTAGCDNKDDVGLINETEFQNDSEKKEASENESLTENSTENVNKSDTEKNENIRLITYDESIYTELKIGDDNENHVIRESFTLAVDISDKDKSDSLISELLNKDSVVNSIITDILKNKTFEELKNPDSEANLKKEVLESLRQEFNSDLIVDVYLSNLFLK